MLIKKRVGNLMLSSAKIGSSIFLGVRDCESDRDVVIVDLQVASVLKLLGVTSVTSEDSSKPRS